MIVPRLIQLSRSCSGVTRSANLMKYQSAGISGIATGGLRNQIAIFKNTSNLPALATLHQGSLSAAVMKLPVRAYTGNTASGQPNRSHSHDHAKMWNAERLLSAALIAVIPASFYIPSPVMNYALALSLVVHTHWGLEAIVVDYIRPSVFGPTIPKLALGGLYLVSILTLAGLFYFNYSDVGLVTGLRMLGKV